MSVSRMFKSIFGKPTSRRSNRRSSAGASLALREVRVEPLEDRMLLTLSLNVSPIQLAAGAKLNNLMIQATATDTVDGVTVNVQGWFEFQDSLDLAAPATPRGSYEIQFNPVDRSKYEPLRTLVPVTILSPPDLATTKPQILGPASAVLTGVIDPGNSPADTYFQYTAGSDFTPSEPSTIASGFVNPSAIAVDMLGNVYVAETGNDAIRIIPADGSAIKTFGSGFKAPTNVAVDAAGNVFVNDAGNGVVKQIFRDGTIIEFPSGSTLPAGSLKDPAGNIYELDQANGSVRKLAVPSISRGTLSHQNDPISLTHTLNGLTPGATYSYRLVARNNDGFAVGQKVSFVAGQPPYSLNDNFSIGGGGGATYLTRSVAAFASTPILLDGRQALAVAGPAPSAGGFPSLTFVVADPLLPRLSLFPTHGIEFIENPVAISDMTSADFNGDGFPDLAVTGESLSVFLSDRGRFNSLPTSLPVSFPQTVGVTAGDLNDDGKPEVLVTGTGGGIDVFVNKGDGAFQNALHFAGPGTGSSVSIADINRDGKPDIITTDLGTNSVGIYTGKGDATFNPRIAVGLNADAYAIAIADLNQDQLLDMVVTNSSSQSITLMKNNGDGSFTSEATYSVGLNSIEIKLADINGDGKQDLVVGNRGTIDSEGSVSLLFGLGDFAFAEAVSLGFQFYQDKGLVTPVSDTNLLGMHVIDFTQSGRPEIVMVSGIMGVATVTYDGPRFFGEPTVPIGAVSGRTSQLLMETADVNSDGLLDVIANKDTELILYTNLGKGRFRQEVLRNGATNPSGFLVTDLNGDGHQDIVYSHFNRSYRLLNDGRGTFISDGESMSSVVDLQLLDVNSDGLMDLFGHDRENLYPKAFLNHGGGVFGRVYKETAFGIEKTFYYPDYSPNMLTGTARASGDLNNDGKDDIVWTRSLDNPNQISVTVNLSNNEGGYTSTVFFTPDSGENVRVTPSLIPVIADFDHDGKLDLVVRGINERNLFLYRNNGNGTFGVPIKYSLLSGITSMASGDFNGDGFLDIAVTRFAPQIMAQSSNVLPIQTTSVSLLTGDGQGAFTIRHVGNFEGDVKVVSGRFDSSGRDSLFTPNGLLTMISPEITLDQVNLPRQVPAGTTVGDITATSTGVGGISYSLVNGTGDTDNALFSLDSKGRLKTTAALDASVKSNYSIRVKSIDSVGVIGEQVISVALKSVSLTNVVSALQDTTSTNARTKVADISISAVSSSANTLSLSGPDATAFEISDGQLFLKAGVTLSVAKLSYNVTINVDDPSLSGSPDASANYTLNITSLIPTNLSVSTPTFDMTPTVTWSPGVNAVRYEVYVQNLATSQVIRQTVTETSWTPSTDLGIARYQVWVRSINTANVRSTWSLPATFVVNTPVTIPAQTLGQTVRPQITWTALPGAVSYEIWLTDASRKIAPFIQQTGLTSTSWTPASDLALGAYAFWVRGIDAGGRTAAWSAKLTFNIQAAPVPGSLMASTFSRQPTFSWTSPAGAASFVLTLANQTTGATQTISGITGTSWTLASNLADGRWTWRVRAVSQFGSLTYWSELAQLQIGGQTIVSAPTANRTSPATFNWLTVSGAASYSLWVNRVDVPQTVIRRDNITTNSFTTSTPLAAGTYRVWVRAVSTSGEVSIWSRAVDLTVAGSDSQSPESQSFDHSGVANVLLASLSTLLNLASAPETVDASKETSFSRSAGDDQSSKIIADRSAVSGKVANSSDETSRVMSKQRTDSNPSVHREGQDGDTAETSLFDHLDIADLNELLASV